MASSINASTSGIGGIISTADATGILQINTAQSSALTFSTSQDVTCNSTGAFAVPSGTTAQRPSSPANGMLRYNTTIPQLEIYLNGSWTALP